MTGSGLLTAAEVAERTGYSARTIIRWADADKIEVAHRLYQGERRVLLFSEDVIRRLPRKLGPEEAA